MITERLQIALFIWISASFVTCLGVVVWHIVRDSIRKPVRHEAVILQFRPRARKGHFHG